MRRSPLLATALVLASCGILSPAPAEVIELAVEPFEAPDGPVVRLGRGQLAASSWEVVAYRAANGDICTLQVVDDLRHGGGCGPAPVDGAAFGPLAATQVAVGVVVEAVLSGDVRRVRIETAGEPIEADVLSLAPLGLEATGLAIALPQGEEPAALVALDAAGQELDRFDLLPIGPGAVPTPESP